MIDINTKESFCVFMQVKKSSDVNFFVGRMGPQNFHFLSPNQSIFFSIYLVNRFSL